MENFDILTTLKCILSHSKQGDRKIFCSFRSQGASIHGLPLGLEKLSAALHLPDKLVMNLPS